MAERELTIVGGPNGAGKTTFALEYLQQHSERCVYLSADLIAAELSPAAPMEANVAAGREFIGQLRRRLALGESLLVESTLAGRSLLKSLESAAAYGYSITILFVFVDSVETCIARVKERARKGGHDIPEADIRRRFSRALANFWHLYRPLANTWLLAYNSNGKFVHVAEKQLAETTVYDQTLLDQFFAFSGLETND